MRQRRKDCRPTRKLEPGSELFDRVVYWLRKRFSPQLMAGKLRSMECPNVEATYVCRETIYNAIYVLPVGELRKELILCLRQGKARQRSGGVDRRGQIPERVDSLRPPGWKIVRCQATGRGSYQGQGQCLSGG